MQLIDGEFHDPQKPYGVVKPLNFKNGTAGASRTIGRLECGSWKLNPGRRLMDGITNTDAESKDGKFMRSNFAESGQPG